MDRPAVERTKIATTRRKTRVRSRRGVIRSDKTKQPDYRPFLTALTRWIRDLPAPAYGQRGRTVAMRLFFYDGTGTPEEPMDGPFYLEVPISRDFHSPRDKPKKQLPSG